MDWVIILLVFIILELMLIGIRLGNILRLGNIVGAGLVEVRDVLKEIHQELGLEDLGGGIREIDISLSQINISLSQIDHSLSEIDSKIADIQLSMSSDD